jgi:hypothetical protein
VRRTGSESFVRVGDAWSWLRIICEDGRCVELAQNHDQWLYFLSPMLKLQAALS